MSTENTKNGNRFAYICFQSWDVTRNASFTEISKMTLMERFNKTIQAHETFTNTSSNVVGEFIFHDSYCYVFKTNEGTIDFNQTNLRLVPYLMLSIGDQKYPLDVARLRVVQTAWSKQAWCYEVKSNSYRILKLPSPYRDHCMDYTKLGFLDMNDAIAYQESNESVISWNKIAWKQFYGQSNYLVNSETKILESSFKIDCDKNLFIHFVKTRELEHHLGNDSQIWFYPDTEASFSFVSKPRIDDIDYVNFILGALGSWLGFSLIGLNPVPHFLKIVNDNQAVEDVNQGSDRQQINILKAELTRLKTHQNKLNQQMQQIKKEFDQSNDITNHLKQNINNVLIRVGNLER